MINRAVFHETYNEMVVVKDIRFYSLCEHHMLPFFGTAAVAYIPNGKIIGLSKIPKMVEVFSLGGSVWCCKSTHDATNRVKPLARRKLSPLGVAVRHPGAATCAWKCAAPKKPRLTDCMTSAMLGAFREKNAHARAKSFLSFTHCVH